MSLAGIVTVLGLLLPSTHFAQTEITRGSWYNDARTGSIEFFIKDSKLYGKVAWFKDPERKDVNNPDPKLRNRKLIGIVNLTGFVTTDQKHWTDGKIYDPESGKTYSSKITLVSKNELSLRGYIGSPLFGRSAKFTRSE